MSNKFIDISAHNTILSFNGLISCNFKGVIMKATEGTTYTDPALEVNYDALRDKVPIGFYHFLRKTSEPETQAQNFWNRIKDKDFQIMPVVDVESYGDNDELGNYAQSYTDRFMKEFYRLSGCNMIIYSGRCYIEEHFDVSFRKENKWWTADYSANDVPIINGCDVIAWQYTEDERSYAFTMGELDCNILVNEDKFYIVNNLPYTDTESIGNDSIFELQSLLNNQGFRDKNGRCLDLDGIGGELTLSACPLIREGAVGQITQWIQYKLGIEPDGLFGEETRQAVIEFQENKSLDGDGIVGKNTWRKLIGL